MSETNWLSYIVIIMITTFIVSVMTENSVIRRIQTAEGIWFRDGMCRLRPGYGLLPGTNRPT
jgi:hypothetical protein